MLTLFRGVAGMFALSWYVNPRGNFGPTGYQFLYNARLAKTNWLDRVPRERLPQVIVLASSTTMQYSQEMIANGLGKSAFNYAVSWARAEDLLCIMRHVTIDLQHRPELLLVGIDTWTFMPDGNERIGAHGFQRRLLNTPQLIRHHPDANPASVIACRLRDAFNGSQLRLAWHLWRTDRRGRMRQLPLDQQRGFRPDGTRTFYLDPFSASRANIFDAVEAGRYPITAKLQSLIDENRLDALASTVAAYDFEGLHPRRIEYLREMLKLCQQNAIDVIFVLHPVHPVFHEVLATRTPHLRNLAALRSLLSDLENEFAIVRGVVDASHLDSIGGDPDGFFDPIHPATRNCERILARIADLLAASPEQGTKVARSAIR